MIRTPDQRLRVFLSSTLAELATERSAAKAAIEGLRLTPVLFESGARPHAPTDVYRAYLEQSDVFVGIYGNSYGWVAPDMEISGLEDEYRLSKGKPRLIYVKRSAEPREERLERMLAKIKATEGLSYQKFSTVDELREHLQQDLAVLLSERFIGNEKGTSGSRRIPSLRGPTFGREGDLQALRRLVLDEHGCLVTVTGPGGTGKSRMGLLVAHEVRGAFDDVAFVALASITAPEMVAQAIANALELFDTGRRSTMELLKDVLADKHTLLLLDNFEHLLPAAPLLTELLDHCPGLKLLVTSRTPLHLRGEQVYPLSPLLEPDGGASASISELMAIPSVRLFVQRARESSPHLVLDDGDVRAIADICTRLDGLPLAIELAAANTRLLRPTAILDRMSTTAHLPAHGARDLPERQRTMRATITWSHDLLGETARVLFRRLAVMMDRWILSDAEAVADMNGTGALPELEELVDHGLVRMFPVSTSDGEATFALLHVVREYALARLEASGEMEACKDRHAVHFASSLGEMEHGMMTTMSDTMSMRMERIMPDVRVAFARWVTQGRMPEVWELIGNMRGYWAYAGMIGEALTWIQVTGLFPECDVAGIPFIVRGRALMSAGLTLSVAGEYAPAVALLMKALPLLEKEGMPIESVRTLNYLSLAQLSMGDKAAFLNLERAAREAVSIGSDFDACFAIAFLCEALISADKTEMAEHRLDEARRIAEGSRSSPARAIYFLQHGNLSLVRGRLEEAEQSYAESMAAFKTAHMRPMSGWAIWGAAYTNAAMGRLKESREGFHACMDRARSTSDRAMVTGCLLGFAWLEVEEGRPENGTLLLAAADHIAQEIHYSFWSTDRPLHKRVKEGLQRHLSPEDFERAYQRGAQLSQEQAIALAGRSSSAQT